MTLDKILQIVVTICLSIFAISLLINTVKSLGKSEGYKIKELEIKQEQLQLELMKEKNRNLHITKEMENERTQKSNIMLEIFNQTLNSGKSPEEMVDEMLHNREILYKKEEL